MNYVTSIFSSFKGYYDNINGATLTGALDVIVVRHPNGTFTSSPFHVRFGKLNVLHSSEKVVDITVNGRSVNLHMKLGHNGEAFFVKECEEDEYPVPQELSTSPIQTGDPEKLMREGLNKMRMHDFTDSDSAPSDIDTDSEETEFDGQEHDIYYRGEDCLSDSELLTTQQTQNQMDSDSRIVWKWGTLPEDPGPSGDKGQEIPGGFMSGMWEYIGRRGRKRKNTFSGTLHIHPADPGVFLDDIDTTDPDAVAHYFGVNKRFGRRNSNKGYIDSDDEDAKFRQLDALSLERPRFYRSDSVTVSEMDHALTMTGLRSATVATQTRLVPRRSKRVQTIRSGGSGGGGGGTQPTCHLHPDVEMSLCGRDRLEQFPEYKLTYEEVEEDTNVLYNEDLVVRVGKEFYVWNDMPGEVLAAIVFKQFRGDVEEAEGEEEEEVDGVTASPDRRRSSVNAGFSGDERDRSATHSSGGLDDTMDDYNELRHRVHFKKTIRLTSKDIEELELKEGANIMTFSVTTSYQGTTKAQCTVYLWDYKDKIIISDIDGTITRSDIFGHILPWMGKDWTHINIAKLFSSIAGMGYKFLYLSSRAIGQAAMTKTFLSRIRQEGVGIPEGPVLLSPDSLLRALKTEIVLRQPHIFKTECLKDIKGLFGEDSTPFYAGFGNRRSDSISYQAVCIPKTRIFIVNHKGEIRTENSLVQQSTYGEIFESYEIYFPPLLKEDEKIEEDFLAQNYWKTDVLDVAELENDL